LSRSKPKSPLSLKKSTKQRTNKIFKLNRRQKFKKKSNRKKIPPKKLKKNISPSKKQAQSKLRKHLLSK